MSDLRKAADPYIRPGTVVRVDIETTSILVDLLRQALAEPANSTTDFVEPKAPSQTEQEPAAWMWKDGSLTSDPDYADGTWTPLYTAPPKREWVGLTEADIYELLDNEDEFDFAQAIEAKLKEKNT